MKDEVCCKCGSVFVVNKTYKLCQFCNAKRLKDQRSPDRNAEIERKVKSWALVSVTPLKQKTPLKQGKKRINKVSKKQKEVGLEYGRVIQELKVEREFVCECCGRGDRLSLSHLVPRSFDANLITEKKNIRWHCMSMGSQVGCHTKWENPALRQQLELYEEYMEMVKEMNIKYYRILKAEEVEQRRKKTRRS